MKTFYLSILFSLSVCALASEEDLFPLSPLGQGLEQSETIYKSLHEAAKAGCSEDVQWFLQHFVPVDSTISINGVSGITPLQLAARSGHTEVVHILMSWGAQPDLCNSKLGTALILASRQGHLETVKNLLIGRTDTAAANILGRTALICAAFFNRADVLEVLLEKAKLDNKLEEVLNAQDNLGMTALMHAALKGHLKSCQVLVEKGAKVDLLNSKGMSALILAVRDKSEKHIEVVNYLCSKHANIFLGKHPAVIHACRAGSVAVLKELHLYCPTCLGVLTTNNINGLMLAARAGHLDVVEFLLSYAPELISSVNGDGYSAACDAALKDQVEVVRCLTLRGANLLSVAINGMTALSVAVQAGSYKTVKFILDYLKANNLIGLKQLLSVKRKEGNTGDTPLHIAVRSGRTDTVQMLLDAGASLAASNNAGEKPFNLVRTLEMQLLLQSYMDKRNREHSNNFSKRKPT